MKEYFAILKENPLFSGVSIAELPRVLACIRLKEAFFSKNEVVLHSGDTIDFVGLVLSGSVKIVKEDSHGSPLLLAEIGRGELFAEVFACAEISHSPVSVVAMSDCKILYLDYKKVISSCENSCAAHGKLIGNMLKILARKNLFLNQKIDVLSKTRLREKLLAYFVQEGKGAKSFRLSLNREELASYLCADRSALSRELSKMQQEGLISYHGRHIELLS